jgi:hypothetical protein
LLRDCSAASAPGASRGSLLVLLLAVLVAVELLGVVAVAMTRLGCQGIGSPSRRCHSLLPRRLRLPRRLSLEG